jgi:glycosyltransferase involved in cell wall biosynthesis
MVAPRCGSVPADGAAIRLAAFSGGPSVASARLRTHQLIGPLRRLGIVLESFDAASSSYPPRVGEGSRVAWLGRELTARGRQVCSAARRSLNGSLIHREFVSTLPTLEGLAPRPVVFDVDDAIWLRRHGIAAHAIARRSRLVLAGNRFLAEHFSDFAPVCVVPTAVDVSFYGPNPVPADRLRIGWCGQSSGFPYLSLVEDSLRIVLENRPEVEFAVMADRPPSLSLPAGRVRFEPWSLAAEAAFLRSLAIGIMPLRDGVWERGKCSYKMLSYMASGIPAVVSPVGMNADVLSEADVGIGAVRPSDWIEALISLLDDASLVQHLGKEGRALTERRYSVEVIAAEEAAALRTVFA